MINLIARTKARLAELELEDTPKNRREWSLWAGQLAVYEWHLENGVNPFLDTDDPENPTAFLGGGPPDEEQPPPWQLVEKKIEPATTLAVNVKRFLQRKEAQAKRGERSIGHFESLRVGLEGFVEYAGSNRPIEGVNTALLSRFRDELESLVDQGKMRPHSARNRLQAVKQFVRWAWQEDSVTYHVYSNPEIFPSICRNNRFGHFLMKRLNRC